MINQAGMISASFARRVAAVVRRVERDGGGPKNAAGMGSPLRREEGGSSGVIGTAQGQVHVMTTDNQDGWDFVRAHA